MSKVRVEIKGVREVHKMLEDVRKTLLTELPLSLASSMAEKVKENRFLSRYPTVVSGEASRAVLTIHDVPAWLLCGSKPHIILPKRAKALRFMIGREVIFAKRVRHSGTRALVNIGYLIRESLPSALGDALRRGLSKLGWRVK